MTQYNILNVKLFNSQLSKLKSRIKNGTQVTLNLSSNVMTNTTNAQVLRLSKVFPSANTKFSKTQLSKIGQPRWFLGRLLGSLRVLLKQLKMKQKSKKEDL